MSYLLIGDTHLTDRPRDAYRFGIFKWIAAQQAKYKPKATFIMGDLCDSKDRHSAGLVNRIVDELEGLDEVYILMGNHDYIDPKQPFFKFLSKLENVHFVIKPSIFGNVAMIPHCRTQEAFDQACKSFGSKKLDLLLLHNTFTGAISETNKQLSGLSIESLSRVKAFAVYAGDVHRPQRGSVTYIGSPYTVRFGDDFEPRCLLFDGGKETDLYFSCPRKWKLTVSEAQDILNNKKLFEGDQVKVIVELAREEAVEWQTHRKEVFDVCKRLGLEVFGINLKVNTIKKKTKGIKAAQKPADIVAAFCLAEGVGSQIRQVGLNIVEG